MTELVLKTICLLASNLCVIMIVHVHVHVATIDLYKIINNIILTTTTIIFCNLCEKWVRDYPKLQTKHISLLILSQMNFMLILYLIYVKLTFKILWFLFIVKFFILYKIWTLRISLSLLFKINTSYWAVAFLSLYWLI